MVVRDEDYYILRPDGLKEQHFAGEIIASFTGSETDNYSIALGDLIGQMDDGARYSICLLYTSILKPGQLFYCNRNGTVVYKGTGTKAAISKRYRLIKVNKLPRDYKNKLKPGDICFYRLHTNIFAGINESNKMVWWDAGKASTNTKKAGGTYKKIHRVITVSYTHLCYVFYDFALCKTRIHIVRCRVISYLVSGGIKRLYAVGIFFRPFPDDEKRSLGIVIF